MSNKEAGLSLAFIVKLEEIDGIGRLSNGGNVSMSYGVRLVDFAVICVPKDRDELLFF